MWLTGSQTLMAEPDIHMIDAPEHADLAAASGHAWRLVTDGVMGGVSKGRLTPDEIDGRRCLRMRGEVSLDNNGGFVQMTLDLGDDTRRRIADYTGIVMEVYGNGEQYNVHLRTRDLWLPWQSYRAGFTARPEWQRLYIPFSAFAPHRVDGPLDVAGIERIGLVAIGREFHADLCLGALGLY